MQRSTRLSKREKDVVHFLLEGKSNKLIALDMKVSERTIEFHLKNIYSKFQVSSRMELVLKLKNGIHGLESEKLGFSTVAEKGLPAENGGGLSSSNWVTSLRDAAAGIGKELKMKVASVSNTNNETGPVTFFESIRTCLTKYAEFNGRASRSEFWWFALFVVICASAFALLDETLEGIFLLAVLLPLLAVGARRLRDSGKSAWWLFFLLVPIGGLVTLGFVWAQPSMDSLTEKREFSA